MDCEKFYFWHAAQEILRKNKTDDFFFQKGRISARKLTIVKQHDVSTTSCHHCQINKLETTEGHIYRSESEKID